MNTRSSPYRDPKARGGFSLMEMLVVLLIIGLLTSAVAYNFVGAGERGRARATKVAIRNIEQALQDYQFTTGSFPATAEGLAPLMPSYLTRVPLDGWKHPFAYASPAAGGQPYEIISSGPDGELGTEDDIISWRDLED